MFKNDILKKLFNKNVFNRFALLIVLVFTFAFVACNSSGSVQETSQPQESEKSGQTSDQASDQPLDQRLNQSSDQVSKQPTEQSSDQSSGLPAGQNNTPFPLEIAPGFRISVYAQDLGGPRVMTFDPAGHLLVSKTAQGEVVALIDENNDGVSDRTVTILDDLNSPHGILIRCNETDNDCKLYVAETNQVAVYNYDKENLRATERKPILDLPAGGRHFTRTLSTISTLDGEKLLISIGSSCDVCIEKDERLAAVLIANFDGSDAKIYAKGLRNAVFMATNPVTGKIWVTEMGRDFLGDNLPPDEINILEEGKNYGWPYCFGKNQYDTQFDGERFYEDRSNENLCGNPPMTSSYINIPAHSAPLGLAFIPEEGWPEQYWYDLLVAYHGSWNRSSPTGYKVVRYKLDEKGNVEGEEDFISGWLRDGVIVGRPVDILVQPGGVMYISDDKAGMIYRVVSQFTF